MKVEEPDEAEEALGHAASLSEEARLELWLISYPARAFAGVLVADGEGSDGQAASVV